MRGIHPQRIKWFERLPRKQHAQRIASQCDLFLDHLLYGRTRRAQTRCGRPCRCSLLMGGAAR